MYQELMIYELLTALYFLKSKAISSTHCNLIHRPAKQHADSNQKAIYMLVGKCC